MSAGLAALAAAGALIAGDVAFEQRLGADVPAAAAFVDRYGRARALGDYLGERPTLLVPAYFDCPNLCNLVLDGVAEAVTDMRLRPGRDFGVVVVGIDPGEGPAEARAFAAHLQSRYADAGMDAGWSFLTGSGEDVHRVTDAIGFRYAYDAERDEYAHAAGLVVVSPDGRVSKYLFGVRFAGAALRLALVDAGGGRIGGLTDRLLLLCYGYDPATGRYSPLIGRIVAAAGIATVAVLAAGIAVLRRRERGTRSE